MRPTRADTLLVALGAVVSGLGGFGFTWVLARGTGPSGAAVVLSVTTWFTLAVTLGKLGMDTALVREGGRVRAGGAGVGPRTLMRWFVLPVTVAAAALGVVVVALSAPIGLLILPDSPVSLTPLVAAGGVFLGPAVFTIVCLALIRGLGSVRSFVIVEQLVKPLLRVSGAALLLVAGAGPILFGWSWFAPVAVGALATLGLAWRYWRSWGVGDETRGERSRVWSFARPRAASQAMDIVNTSLGTIALGILSTAEQTGAFATAFRVVVAGQLAFQAVRLLLAPSFAAYLSLGRRDQADEVFSAGASLIVSLSWPVFLVCVLWPDLLLGLFGADFKTAAVALQILAISGLFLAVTGNQGSVVLMSGRSGTALAAVTLATAVNAAITIPLVADYGATAAAIGWTAGVVAEGLVLAVAVAKEGLRPLPRNAIKTGAAVLGVLAPAILAARFLAAEPVVAGVILILGLVATALVVGPNARRQFHKLTGEGRA